MNTDERIRKMYAGVFDDLNASEELKRKVRNMTETKKKRNIRTAVKIAYAAAAAAAVLVAGNVIAYATTGETMLRVFINGEEQTEFSYTFDEGIGFKYEPNDGEQVYVNIEGDFSENEGGEIYIYDTDGGVGVTYNVDIADPDDVSNAVSTALAFESITDVRTELVEEDGKTYLSVNDMKIDITEDYKDGTAEGTFEMDGEVFYYTVTSEGDISLLIAE